MEFNFRPHRNPMYRTQSSSSYTYFTEQAIQAGLPRGRFGGGGGSVGPEMFRGPADMRETIQRELEKERIREEIIAEEIARKRMLEAEVRRELMMEREMMAMRGGGGGGGFSSPFMPFSPPANHYNRFEQRMPFRPPVGGVGRSLEERIGLSMEEKYGGGSFRENAGFGTVTFQRLRESAKIREVTPEDSKQEVIILNKPGAGALSGTKRKSISPAAACSGEARTEAQKKKPKEEWSCAICQVTATSERGLNEHLGGKRHQAKEAALRAQKTGANLGLGVTPKKPTTKPLKLALTATVNPSSSVKNAKIETKLVKSQPLVITNSGQADSNDSKKHRKIAGEDKKEKFRFWCQMCQVGADNQKVMNNHKRGRKHLSRLLELHQAGGGAALSEKVHVSEEKPEAETKKAENLEEVAEVEAVKDMVRAEEGDGTMLTEKTGTNLGLGVTPKKLNKPLKLALTTTVNPSSSEKNAKIETKSVKSEPLVMTNSDDAGSNDSKKYGKIVGEDKKEKFKFWCEMCQAGADNQKVMNDHKRGKKHICRLLQLHQKGGAGALSGKVHDSKVKPQSEKMEAENLEEVAEELHQKDAAGGADALSGKVHDSEVKPEAEKMEAENLEEVVEELHQKGAAGGAGALSEKVHDSEVKPEAETKEAENLEEVFELEAVIDMDDINVPAEDGTIPFLPEEANADKEEENKENPKEVVNDVSA